MSIYNKGTRGSKLGAENIGRGEMEWLYETGNLEALRDTLANPEDNLASGAWQQALKKAPSGTRAQLEFWKKGMTSKMAEAMIESRRGTYDTTMTLQSTMDIYGAASKAATAAGSATIGNALGALSQDPKLMASFLLKISTDSEFSKDFNKLRGGKDDALNSVLYGVDRTTELYKNLSDPNLGVDERKRLESTVRASFGSTKEGIAQAEALISAGTGGRQAEFFQAAPSMALAATKGGTKPDTASATAAGDATYQMMMMKNPYDAQVYQGMSNVSASLGVICKLLGVPQEKG